MSSPQNGFQYDVFISHASENIVWCKRLFKHLEESELKPWLDVQQVQRSAQLTEAINQGLAESRCFVPVMTKAYFAKIWTKAELNSAINMMNSGERDGNFIIPVLLDNCEEDIPPLLKDAIRIDFRNNREFTKKCRELIERLRDVKAIQPSAKTSPPPKKQQPQDASCRPLHGMYLDDPNEARFGQQPRIEIKPKSNRAKEVAAVPSLFKRKKVIIIVVMALLCFALFWRFLVPNNNLNQEIASTQVPNPAIESSSEQKPESHTTPPATQTESGRSPTGDKASGQDHQQQVNNTEDITSSTPNGEEFGGGGVILPDPKIVDVKIKYGGKDDEQRLKYALRMKHILSYINGRTASEIAREPNLKGFITDEAWDDLRELLQGYKIEVMENPCTPILSKRNDQLFEVRTVPVSLIRPNKGDTLWLIFSFDQGNSPKLLSIRYDQLAYWFHLTQDQNPLQSGSREYKRLDGFFVRVQQAYNSKDIAGLRTVFVDTAEIVVAKVTDDNVQYFTRDKESYFDSLQKIFDKESRLKVEFSNFQHRRVQDNRAFLYFVEFNQLWDSSSYYDYGTIFMLIESDPQKRSLIIQRSWKPTQESLEHIRLGRTPL